jgi:hypothetical protein
VIAVALVLTAVLGATGTSSVAGLRVDRGLGAETCASASELAQETDRRVGAHLLDPESPAGVALRIEVAFSRQDQAFRAELRAHGRFEGARTIEDRSPSCAGLVEAVTLALALIVRPMSAPEPAPPLPSLPRVEVVPTPVEPRAPRFSVEVGGGAITGIVSDASPTLEAGVAWRALDPWSIQLDATLIPASTTLIPPGAVRSSLLGGRALGCRRWFGEARGLGFDACATATLGLLSASSSGFTTTGSADRPWFGAGLAAVVRGPIAGPLGWTATGGALLVAPPQRFTVENVRTLYTPAKGAAFLTIGASWSIE